MAGTFKVYPPQPTISPSGVITMTGYVISPATGSLSWLAQTKILSPADGKLTFTNNAGTGFTQLNLGGTTASFPALKRSSATIALRLADDSADAALTAAAITASGVITGTAGTANAPGLALGAANDGAFQAAAGIPALTGAGVETLRASATLLQVPAASIMTFNGRSTFQSTADGFLMMQNNAATGFTGLRFGGSSASFPMWKRSGTALVSRLADDSADAPATVSIATLSAASNQLVFKSADSSGGLITWTGGIFTFQRGDTSGASGSIAASGSVTATTNIFGNTSNTSNTGLQLGATTNGIFVCYTGTATVYKLRDSNGSDGKGYIIQGQYTVPKTTNYAVTAADNGTHFVTTGAAGSVQFTLPTAAIGLSFKFTATAAQTMTVTVGAGSIFGSGSLTGATRTVSGGTAATQYGSLTVTCYDGSNYVITEAYGTIT